MKNENKITHLPQLPMQTDMAAQIQRLQTRRAQLKELIALQKEVVVMERHLLVAGDHASKMVRTIAEVVCEHFNLEIALLTQHTRESWICVPRQIVWYLSRQLTLVPLAGIGRVFGRDHGTIMHGVSTTRDRMTVDADFRRTVEALKAVAAERLLPLTKPLPIAQAKGFPPH